MKSLIAKTALVLAAAMIAFASVPAQAASTASTPAAVFVQKLGDTALMSLTSKKMNRSTREARVRDILEKNFDIAAIGKFALGTHWRDISDTQRGEYTKLFENMIVQTYTTRFEDYAGQNLKVSGAAASGKTDFLVDSQVIQKDGPPINLQWRVRQKDEGLRVVDVVVEGVSMSVTQRSDFAAVIQNGGGKVEALLTSMRERSAAAKKS